MTIPTDLTGLLGNFGDTAERIERLCAKDQAKSMGLEATPSDAVYEPLGSVVQETAQEGVQALRKLAEDRTAALSAAQLLGLEAVVCLEQRPALLVRDGDFASSPGTWSHLDAEREGIQRSLRCVGRIEVRGHERFDWMGTGFLAGENTIITNRHVAIQFSEQSADGDWTFRQGMSSSVDLIKEQGSQNSLEFVVTDVIGCHSRYDLAVLRIEAQSDSGASLPGPLALESSEIADVDGRQVYVVGYPAKDEKRNVSPEMERIFSQIYDVKRLQPGYATSYVSGESSMQHDCSTLGGNSGSPVFDLETHRVIGLHFAGRYRTANYAVPFWILKEDPLLRGADVAFH